MLTTCTLITVLSLLQPAGDNLPAVPTASPQAEEDAPEVDDYFEKNRLDLDWKFAEAWAAAHPFSYLRVELDSPGGPMPFVLEVESVLSNEAGFVPEHPSDWEVLTIERSFAAKVLNDEERIAGRMAIQGGGYAGPAKGGLGFEQYDSVLSAVGTGSCTTPSVIPQHFFRWGTWTKKRGQKDAEMEFVAIPVESPDDRFDVIEDAGKAGAFGGRWSVDFESSDELAIGTFAVDANQIASGTFLITTGDYRYLAGRVDGDLMRLSTFDGAHAFLFHARLQDDGSIEGDFWSGNWHHETWTAVRDDDAQLPDAFGQTTVTDGEAIEELVFKDLDGTPTRVLDVLDRSGAKARIIEIFGSWCPNCSDAGRELVSLKESFGDDLAIVGLAFEITEDFERSVEQVKRHHEHIGSDWPILIGGLYDKDKATETLGFLDRVRSYPTLVFLDEQNQVQAVYSGFSGPATGEAYTTQRARFEELIRSAIESDL